MFHDIHLYISPLHLFLSAHSEALQNAALLIGGQLALRRTQRLLDDIMQLPLNSRLMQREIQALYRLLSLQDVPEAQGQDVDRLDQIEPGSPIVEEICLLTDDLASAMRQSGIEPDDAADRFTYSAITDEEEVYERD